MAFTSKPIDIDGDAILLDYKLVSVFTQRFEFSRDSAERRKPFGWRIPGVLIAQELLEIDVDCSH
jgi:hypothetical protein